VVSVIEHEFVPLGQQIECGDGDEVEYWDALGVKLQITKKGLVAVFGRVLNERSNL
jgi:hypothetical protein